ncbi:MAG TPA: hypothetical protein VKY74_20880 [Chloroflexia bacterium]|nr:hypothetical protein [Chloroflexia bacterium]
MISAIMPLGQRHRHWTFWTARGILYIAATTGSGAVTGALAGLAGAGLQRVFPFTLLAAVAILLGGAYGLHELGVWRLPQPQRAWQVPNRWIAQRPLLGAVAFGLVIGTGVLTFIPFTSFYLLLAWEVLTASPAAGALLGGLYGLARALPVLLGGLSMRRGTSVATLHLNILGATPQIHRVSSGVLLLGAAILIIPLLLATPLFR